MPDSFPQQTIQHNLTMIALLPHIMMTIAQCQFYFCNEIDLLFVLSGKNNKMFVNNRKKIYNSSIFIRFFIKKQK
jgi:hypothetical protein